MRYERSGPESGSSVPWSRQRRRVFMVVAAVVIALGGVLAGVVISNGSKKVVVIGALAKPYLEANALIQSLGAPAPLSMPSTTWPLAGDALRHASASPALLHPERRWVDSNGKLIALTPSEGASILASQRLLAASVMTGTLLADTQQQLGSIVHGEFGPHPHISSPGGASIAAWYSMTAHGDTASVDAAVYTWEQQDSWVATQSGVKLVTSINQAEVEGKATLRRVGGVWKVETLAQAPYQEAT